MGSRASTDHVSCERLNERECATGSASVFGSFKALAEPVAHIDTMPTRH